MENIALRFSKNGIGSLISLRKLTAAMFHLGMYLVGGGGRAAGKPGQDADDLASYTPEAILALKMSLRDKEEKIFHLTNDFSDKETAYMAEIKKLRGLSPGVASPRSDLDGATEVAADFAAPATSAAEPVFQPASSQLSADATAPTTSSSASHPLSSSSSSASSSQVSADQTGALSAQSAAYDAALATWRTEKQELDSQLAQREAQVEQLEGLLREREQLVTQLQKKLQQQETLNMPEPAALQSIMSQNERVLADMKSRHKDEMQKMISEKDKEIFALRSSSSQNCAEQEGELAKVHEEMQSVKKKADLQVQELGEQLRREHEELAGLQAGLHKANQEKELELQKAKQEFEQQNTKNQEEIEDLKKSLASALAQCDGARQDTKNQSEQVVRLQKALKEMRTRMTALQDKSKRMAQLSRTEIQRLQALVDRSNEHLKASQTHKSKGKHTEQETSEYDFNFSSDNTSEEFGDPDLSAITTGVNMDFSDNLDFS
eukprot:g22413.t1